MPSRPQISSAIWIDQIFQSKAAKNNGVVRRSKATVDGFASEADLIAAVKAHKFHMVLCGEQYVILCNTGEFKVVC